MIIESPELDRAAEELYYLFTDPDAAEILRVRHPIDGVFE